MCENGPCRREDPTYKFSVDQLSDINQPHRTELLTFCFGMNDEIIFDSTTEEQQSDKVSPAGSEVSQLSDIQNLDSQAAA